MHKTQDIPGPRLRTIVLNQGLMDCCLDARPSESILLKNGCNKAVKCKRKNVVEQHILIKKTERFKIKEQRKVFFLFFWLPVCINR